MEKSPSKMVYLVDGNKTKVAEDGYYITSIGGTSTVMIAAISVIPDSLNIEAVYKTLGKTRKERSEANKKMFPPDYIFNHNLMMGLPVPAIIVSFDVKKPEYEIDTLNITLGSIKKFKQITHEQVTEYATSRHNSSFKRDIDLINKVAQCNKIPYSEKGIFSDLSIAGNFVAKMMKIYNYACTEACLKQGIPYIGKAVLDAEKEEDLQTFGTFNCPLRSGEAALNNVNLSHFLRHGSHYYEEEELKSFIEEASKTPII